jgi:hypothetical protein
MGRSPRYSGTYPGSAVVCSNSLDDLVLCTSSAVVMPVLFALGSAAAGFESLSRAPSHQGRSCALE